MAIVDIVSVYHVALWPKKQTNYALCLRANDIHLFTYLSILSIYSSKPSIVLCCSLFILNFKSIYSCLFDSQEDFLLFNSRCQTAFGVLGEGFYSGQIRRTPVVFHISKRWQLGDWIRIVESVSLVCTSWCCVHCVVAEVARPQP